MNDFGTAFALIGGILTAVTLLLFVLTKLESSLGHAQRPEGTPAGRLAGVVVGGGGAGRAGCPGRDWLGCGNGRGA